MDTQLVLAPTHMQLHIDGTNVPASNWPQAHEILTAQAAIRAGSLNLSIVDTDGTVHARYTIDHTSHISDAPQARKQADATIELSHWVLHSRGTEIHETFSTVATATDHLQKLATHTNSDVPVQITGIGPSADRTITISAEQGTPAPATVPNGTVQPAQPGNDDDYTTSHGATRVSTEPAPIDELIGDQYGDDGEEQPTDSGSGAEEQDPGQTPSQDNDDLFSDFETDSADESVDNVDTDQQSEAQPTRKLARPVLWGIVSLALLTVIIGLVATTVFVIAPNSDTQDDGKFGQTVSKSLDPVVSFDGKTVAVGNDDGFNFIDASTGRSLNTIDAPVGSTTVDLTKNGFFLSNKDQSQTCTRKGDHVDCDDTKSPSADDTVSARAGTVAFTNTKHPESINALVGTETTTFKAPEEGNSYLAQADRTHALWASAADGGTILTATDNGSVTQKAKLATPDHASKIQAWMGPTSKGDIAVLWQGDGGKDVIATHDPESGKPNHSAQIPKVSDGPKKLTSTGNALLLGQSVFDAETGKTAKAPAVKDIAATSTGFSIDGTYIAANGKTFDEPDNGHIVTTRDDQNPLAVIDGKLAVTKEQ